MSWRVVAAIAQKDLIDAIRNRYREGRFQALDGTADRAFGSTPAPSKIELDQCLR